MDQVAGFIDAVLSAGVKGEGELTKATGEVRAQVMAMCEKYPLE